MKGVINFKHSGHSEAQPGFKILRRATLWPPCFNSSMPTDGYPPSFSNKDRALRFNLLIRLRRGMVRIYLYMPAML